IWENGSSSISDSSWTTQVFDISDVADFQDFVYLRWGYEVGSGAWAYSGWNIDDVEIWGVPPSPPGCPGDINGDGEVGVLDFLDLLAAWGPNAGHPADLDGDGEVGVTDFLALLAAWGPCP
ncbi:MAG: dockerin type I domain-containing protein, partial [Planctomycetota bacterium]